MSEYKFKYKLPDQNQVASHIVIKGDRGEKGEKGDRGEKGEKGDRGETGFGAFVYEKVSTLPSHGEPSKLYLIEKPHTLATATGNPIEIDVANEDAVEDAKMLGKTSQQSSPSPDNPQDIQVVTGKQTVKIQGKNRFNPSATPWQRKVAYDAGGNLANWTGYVGIVEYQPVEPNSTYTFSNSTSKTIYYGLVFYDVDKNKISNVASAARTFTTPANCHYVRFAIQYDSIPAWTQLEKGSTATAFAPFEEGTIEIDLGDIELCKIGNYQDYIYKDGNDWKVHKAISKVMVDGTIGTISNPSANRFNLDNSITDYKKQENSPLALCDRYISIGQAFNNAQFDTMASSYECCIDLGCGTANVLRFKNTKISTSSDFAAALEAHPLTLYCVKATPTDTVITNTSLIAELEELDAITMERGINTITVTATDPNLPADLELTYDIYDSEERFDKFIWFDGWERI